MVFFTFNLRRAAALILAAALLVTAFTACSGGSRSDSALSTTAGTAEADTTETAAETEALDPLEARALVSDELGEYDFGGYNFRCVVDQGGSGLEVGRGRLLVIEEATGDVIDDAVYARNRDISERFNCTVSIVKEDNNANCTSFMRNSVSAGEDAFDLGSMHVIQLGSCAASGTFTNWCDVENVDFEKPWWAESNREVLTINNVCFLAIGAFGLSAMTQTYCIYYNKVMAANYGVEDVYPIVRAGDWTLDRIIGITKDIYTDVNGDGKKDDGDIYGYISNCQSNINAYLWSFDNPIFVKDGDSLKFVFNSEKLPSIVERLCDTFNNYQGIYTNPNYVGTNNSVHYLGRDLFKRSQAVFSNGLLSYSLLNFRELQDEYGIIPYPKWDDAQENYITMSDGNHMGLCMPVTIQDFKRSGTIIEGLCAESWKYVYPAYYDVALKVKLVRDEESVEMLDMVVNSCVYDFGYLYDGWKGCSFFLQTLVKDNNTNFESFWASRESAVLAHYEQTMQLFRDYKS